MTLSERKSRNASLVVIELNFGVFMGGGNLNCDQRKTFFSTAQP